MVRTREEQIDSEFCIGGECFRFADEMTEDQFRQHLNEAEQRGYERARAECADDTKRLDWVFRMMRGSKAERLVGRSVYSNDMDTWRMIIDAAMKGDENV